MATATGLPEDVEKLLTCPVCLDVSFKPFWYLKAFGTQYHVSSIIFNNKNWTFLNKNSEKVNNSEIKNSSQNYEF